MRRFGAWLAASAAVIVALGLLIVLTFDPNWLKPTIERAAARATGHQVRIEGPIELSPSLTPEVRLAGLRVDEPDSGRAWLEIDHARVQIDLLAWLGGKLHLPLVAAGDVVLDVTGQRSAPKPSTWGPDDLLGQLDDLPKVDQLRIAEITVILKSDEQIQLRALALDNDLGGETSELRASGELGAVPLAVRVQLPDLSSLSEHRVLALDVEAEAGNAGLTAAGEIALGEREDGEPLDLELALELPDLQTLAVLAGWPAPDLPAVAARGRLRGDLDTLAMDITEVGVGGSRLTGELNLDRRRPRPALAGTVRIPLLDLEDIDAPDEQGSPGEDDAIERGGLIPAVQLPRASLMPLDLDLQVKLGELAMPVRGPRNLALQVRSADGRLTIETVSCTLWDGDVDFRYQADDQTSPPSIAASLALDDLRLGEIGKEGQEGWPALAGQLDLAASVNGRASDLKTLLDEGSGKIRVVTDDAGELLRPLGAEAPDPDELKRLGIKLQQMSLVHAIGTGEVALDAEASVGALPVGLQLTSEDLDLFLLGEDDMLLALQASLGNGRLEVTGTMAPGTSDPVPSYDLRLALDLPDPLTAGSLAGLPMPELPSLRVRGRVQGDRQMAELADLRFDLGRSDLRGALSLDLRPERPRLTGALRSALVDLKQLGSALSPDRSAQDKADEPLVPPLPMPQATDLPMDLDVTLSIATVEMEPPGLRDWEIAVRSEGPELDLEVEASGPNIGTLDLAYHADDAPMPPEASFRAIMDDLQLLPPGPGQRQALTGSFDLDIDVRLAGFNLRDALPSATGSVRLIMDDGVFRHADADLLGRSALLAVFPTWNEDPQLELKCGLVDLQIGDGRARTRAFLIDAERVVVGGGGELDLERETIDFLITPEAKAWTLAPAVPSVKVTGALADPEVEVQTGGVVKDASVTLLLGMTAPWALLVPMIFGGEPTENACVIAVERARTKAAEQTSP